MSIGGEEKEEEEGEEGHQHVLPEEMKRSSPTGDVSTPLRRKTERHVAHPVSCLPP